jgi:anhydro-N-acetylmuramic acid kinase
MLSFQLGDGAVMYARTGIPVVSDFRSVDVAAGGQGAPLVPVGDKLLFRQYALCLNLGGIANISYDKNSQRLAYDICGCNLILNRLAQQKGAAYDRAGAWAASGRLNTELISRLNCLEYYKLSPPKSLDKETMLAEVMPLFDMDISVEDKLATATLHISMQIAKAVQQAGLNIADSQMLVTGGGAFNTFLIDRLSGMTNARVIVPDDKLVNFKEALVFAFLGLLRIRNEVNSLATVTGADRDTVGGALWGG